MAALNIPNTFITGTTADANEVNNNFETVATFVNDEVVKTDGSTAMTAALDMGGFKVVSIGTPTGTTDASNKAYVDAQKAAVQADGAVTTAMIADLGVTTAKIAADAIDGTKLADNAVNSEHITAGAVDLAHMSVNSVDSDQYVDGSIDRVHLAADVIDSTKLADDAVNSEHYVDGSIDSVHVGFIFVQASAPTGVTGGIWIDT